MRVDKQEFVWELINKSLYESWQTRVCMRVDKQEFVWELIDKSLYESWKTRVCMRVDRQEFVWELIDKSLYESDKQEFVWKLFWLSLLLVKLRWSLKPSNYCVKCFIKKIPLSNWSKWFYIVVTWFYLIVIPLYIFNMQLKDSFIRLRLVFAAATMLGGGDCWWVPVVCVYIALSHTSLHHLP